MDQAPKSHGLALTPPPHTHTPLYIAYFLARRSRPNPARPPKISQGSIPPDLRDNSHLRRSNYSRPMQKSDNSVQERHHFSFQRKNTGPIEGYRFGSRFHDNASPPSV